MDAWQKYDIVEVDIQVKHEGIKCRGCKIQNKIPKVFIYLTMAEDQSTLQRIRFWYPLKQHQLDNSYISPTASSEGQTSLVCTHTCKLFV